jgi:hypothetical protein
MEAARLVAQKFERPLLGEILDLVHDFESEEICAMTMSIPGALANWKEVPKETIASEAMTLRNQNAGLAQDLASVMGYARARLPSKVGPISSLMIALAGAAQNAGLNVVLGPWGLLVNGVFVGAELIGAFLTHEKSPNAFTALHQHIVGQASGQVAVMFSAWLTTWNNTRKNNNAIAAAAVAANNAKQAAGGGAGT